MKRAAIWLFVILIPVIALLLMGTAETCEKLTAPASITVSNAGSADVNGTYTRGPDINGKPSWTNGSYNLKWCSTYNDWELQDLLGSIYYYNGNGSLPAKSADDWTPLAGLAPSPGLSY